MMTQIKFTMMALVALTAGAMSVQADHINTRMYAVARSLESTTHQFRHAVDFMRLPGFARHRADALYRTADRISDRVDDEFSLYAIKGDLAAYEAQLRSNRRLVDRYSAGPDCRLRGLMTQMCATSEQLEQLVEEAIQCRRNQRRNRYTFNPPAPGCNAIGPDRRYPIDLDRRHLPPVTPVPPRDRWGQDRHDVQPRDRWDRDRNDIPPRYPHNALPRDRWNQTSHRVPSQPTNDSQLIVSFLLNSLFN